MEAFESFVALSMESEGLVVSEAVKFKLTLPTRKKNQKEFQAHGYEVDLVGARSDRLVLASVKSFFGSYGVLASEVSGSRSQQADSKYKMLNRTEVRDGILASASSRFGYRPDQIEFRLYAGHFNSVNQELLTREWCGSQIVGSGPIQVFSIDQIVKSVLAQAGNSTYRDNAALVALKVLNEAEQYVEKKKAHLASRDLRRQIQSRL